MCGDCFVCIYLVCQCDGLELGRRNRRITVRGVAVRINKLEGYIHIFLKALYGLKSSGKRWTEVTHGILRDMKFLPSKADPCIWLSKAPNLKCYEYIAVYVDDLCIAAESPSAIIQIFKSKYHLKVKGDGKLTYQLGADYFEDPDGTFVSQPKKSIDIKLLLTRMIIQS